MTALGKLFRATAFRLALAILALSASAPASCLAVVAWQVIKLVDEEIAQTIDAEAKGLTDTYNTDGLARPRRRRSRRASASRARRSIC